ncbi:dynamin family protein [Paenibacillus tianjinensis]|uniref:Dynamin family protein n=1 Tax=Paenibacillus tianjinensis TaxID=2810347 RepID=A0ABX7LGA6_9BACL|nr:dynamin family protein [Paenibacillus tianjinensis]QSF46383.1 dynamin family protein [Paenibacillus tianjinensis]
MYPNTIQAIAQEVLRLLSKQKNLLNEMLGNDQLLKHEGDSQERSLDRSLAKLWSRTLEDEATKVDSLEMTLAVVGTMKAGKSTTINAIVGREVLPNRNRPMTTLPTVIRHKQGQEIPQLFFPKPEPFNLALQTIRETLLKLQSEEVDVLSISATEDGKQLIEEIRSGKLNRLETTYSGVEGIYSFLKSLNDISRLCDAKNLDIQSPLVEYTSLSEFPVIEVEFYHLKGKEQQVKGSLALIDTPGPNEAGQVHLRGILQEQLQKASAVLAILDYTQLNSEADAEVRREIEYISRFSKDRLYVLVNKFDQKDRNSMGENDVKRYVGQELFEGELAAERIYPVSSQYGYLANYALNELEAKGGLPAPENAEWVEDFGQRALGVDWEEDIRDIDFVRRGAQKLWKKSSFSELLDQVISESYSKAALVSLTSAVDKMSHYGNEIIHYLKMRSGSVHMDINELKQFIIALERDIDQISLASRSANKMSSEALGKLTSMTKGIFEEGAKVIRLLIENLFTHGKRLEEEQAKLEGAEKTSRRRPFFQSFFTSENSFVTINQHGPNKFSTKREADAFLDKINDVLQNDIGVISGKIQIQVNGFVESLEYDLQQEINKGVEPILEHASRTLNNAFDMKISFKVHNVKAIKVDFDQISKDAVEEKSVEKIKTKYERKWYTLWLKEHAVEYTVQEEEYHVDTRQIGKKVIQDLEKVQQKLRKELDKYVSEELAQNLTEYFSELTVYLDKFRGNLLDGLTDKQESEEMLGKLLTAMEQFLSIAVLHREDLEPVEEALILLQLSPREAVGV